MKIPAERDGKTVHLSLDEARIEDVEAATRALRRHPPRPRNVAEHALRTALANAAVSFTAVPLAALAKFAGLVA